MHAEFLERLLHEEESPTLDFKRDQYRFAKASDDDKSEILKDILGFANAWRRTDAYILIGVQEVRGERSSVIGIASGDHLDDHSLQQFVNNITNRPLRFRYEAGTVDAKQVGVITIDQQQRPFYLKRDFGRLQKERVYIRRGSSTDPTKPASIDEIAFMGTGAELLTADLAGLAAEVDWNRQFALRIQTAFQEYVDKHGLWTNVSKPSPVPPQRFRIQAVSAYLQRPVAPDDLPVRVAERYWEITSLCNQMMDTVGTS